MIDREKEMIEKSRKTYRRGIRLSIFISLMNIGLILLVLNTDNKGVGHYICLVVLLLVQLLYIFMIRYGRTLRENSVKTIVEFFEKNPEYRQYHSDDINEGISIVGNYIFLSKGAKIIDLSKGSNYEVYVSETRRQRLRSYYNLGFEKDGKRESVFLGTISSAGLDKLRNYLRNYEKLKV